VDPFSIIATLEHQLTLLSRALRQPAELGSIQLGDLVQLAPEADPEFGGYFLFCTNVSHGRARGPLLATYRSLWRNVPLDQVARIGATPWPQASFRFVTSPETAAAELAARNEAHFAEVARKTALRQETLRRKAHSKAG